MVDSMHTHNRSFVIKEGMTPQDVMNSDKATPQQKKMAAIFDSDGVAGYSQREADVFNATVIADHGKDGISLWTRYQDDSKKETKFMGDVTNFKYAPKGDVKPYTVKDTQEVQQVKDVKPANRDTEKLSEKIEELRKVMIELDQLPIENKKTVKEAYTETYGDGQHFVAGNVKSTTGTVNYNGETYKVTMSGYDTNYTKRFFNMDAKLVYELDHDGYGEVVESEKGLERFASYKYDDHNRLKERLYNNSHNWIMRKEATTYTYKDTPDGLVIKESITDEKGDNRTIIRKKPNDFTEIYYDKDNRRIDIEIKDKNGHTIASATEFDDNINNIKIEYNNGKVTKFGDNTYTYNSSGLLESNDSGEKFKYDSKGNVIEVTRIPTKFQIKYDNKNNPIEVKEYHNGVLQKDN